MDIKLKLTFIMVLTITMAITLTTISSAGALGGLNTQTGISGKDYPNTPEAAVEAYCRSDFNGDGLDSDSVKKLWQYTTFEDGPGYDTVTIISGFKVVSTQMISTNMARVTVKYNTLVKDAEIYEQPIIKKGVETTVYKLQKQGGRWKITAPQLQPHISLERMIKHLEELATDHIDESLPEAEQDLQKKLKRNLNLLKKYARNQKGIQRLLPRHNTKRIPFESSLADSHC